MVFSNEEKAIIINNFEEWGWSAYRIVKEHHKKNWDKRSVQRLINRYKESGTVERKTGSGRPKTATTVENGELVEELISSQESEPGSHSSPRGIAQQIGISHSSVRRLIKKKGFRQFKRLKTPRMSTGTRERRSTRAAALAEKFERYPRMIEKAVWQDEKDFTLDVPLNPQNSRVYGKGKKAEIHDENLFHQSNRQSVKVMVSAVLTWNGATKPFFVNQNGFKVNAISYKNILKKNCYQKLIK